MGLFFRWVDKVLSCVILDRRCDDLAHPGATETPRFGADEGDRAIVQSERENLEICGFFHND